MHKPGSIRAALGLLLLLGAAGGADQSALTPLALKLMLVGALLAAWGYQVLMYGPTLPRVRGMYRQAEAKRFVRRHKNRRARAARQAVGA